MGTTASAVTSLSLDPPLVLVCFDLGSLTLRAIRGHGSFAVNVLGTAQRQLSANFARRGLAAAWDGVRHRHGPTGSPRLEDVLAVMECTVEHFLPGGDHEIVVGRVRHAETSAGPARRWSISAAATRRWLRESNRPGACSLRSTTRWTRGDPARAADRTPATASATPWVRDAGFGFPVTTAIRMTSPSGPDELARGWNHGPFGRKKNYDTAAG